jgi:hypothetical protein
MRSSRHLSHGLKAVLLLTFGAAVATIPTVAFFLDTERTYGWVWILLWLATIPSVGWGAWHLALARGYAGPAGCTISIVGYCIGGLIGAASFDPVAVAIGSLFIVALPTLVLLTLPNKTPHSHRRHY